ncbi:hypothetical protein ATZ33_06305 [Enterococcus silesiacus]|uniref:TPM domain-containing protein n=1 Tax=Enterococcus silesiacus TaxID=332949 RepID=A0A0S3K9M4_9ENTE|nr:hypothetical protein [Enterococcus silesiacus]ALS00991.1 hypothetical protein ATZ33_06305 [Enterococcus silesiacus]OJG91784.1 hypothetical protein RV15_GL000451 [Enterococcus silesiacus]
MKKAGCWLLSVFLTSTVFFSLSEIGYAESYVEDQAGKLNQETKDYITKLNKEKFSILEDSPEYGISITRDVDPAGNQIETHIENKFRNFDFKNSEAPVNIVTVFVLDQGKIWFAHGAKFASLFEPLNEDKALKEQLLELISADKYDEAVIKVSDYVYQYVEKAYTEKGLATIVQESDRLKENKLKIQQDKQVFWLVLTAVTLLLAGVGYNAYLNFKKNGLKRQFYAHKVLPARLLKDEQFNQKDFEHWLENSSKKYNSYINKNEAIRAVKYYCIDNFFPKIINQVNAITDQQKQLLKRVLLNRDIGDFFFYTYFADEQFTFLMFNTMTADAQQVSEAYTENLLSHLSKFISALPIKDELLEEKWSLIPKYKVNLYEEAKNMIQQKHRQADYLAKNMLANQSYEKLLAELPEEIEKIVLSCLKSAVFKVDLQQVYELEPIYQEIIENDFSDEDVAEVMLSLRIGYKANQTSILKLKEIVKSVLINMQDTIRERNRRETTIARFDFEERSVKTILRPKSKNRFFD